MEQITGHGYRDTLLESLTISSNKRTEIRKDFVDCVQARGHDDRVCEEDDARAIAMRGERGERGERYRKNNLRSGMRCCRCHRLRCCRRIPGGGTPRISLGSRPLNGVP